MLEPKVVLARIERSRFRSSFHLSSKDAEYVLKIGLQKITDHAYDFVRERLAEATPLRDGRQTPFRGHPVFKAQHATATCCRGCLEKWHQIQKGKELQPEHVDGVVRLIMGWIEKEICRLNLSVKQRLI